LTGLFGGELPLCYPFWEEDFPEEAIMAYPDSATGLLPGKPLRSLAYISMVVLCFSVLAAVSCSNKQAPSQAGTANPTLPAQTSTAERPAPSQPGIEEQPLPVHGDISLLKAVQTLPDEGRDHIWPDHPAEYQNMPPTSGPHFPDPTEPGFYAARPAFGYLVHGLEHGSVVIYYNPARLTPGVEMSIKAFIKSQKGEEYGVIAVPGPEFKVPFILTAWDKKLELDKYDPLVVRAFLAEYLGRGPELSPR
jgi:hypothetical protein